MSARRVRALMERTIAGEDISGEPGVGEPILTTERIEVSPEVMVGKSVKVPMSMVERIEAVADACGSDWSKTIRRWIEEGLARDEVAGPADATALIHRLIDIARELERSLGEQPPEQQSAA